MSEYLHIRVPDGWNERLNESAKRRGITKAQLVRHVLAVHTSVDMPKQPVRLLTTSSKTKLTWGES